MRSALPRNRVFTHVVAFAAGSVAAWLALPLWREALMAWNQGEYGLLVEECDGAMRGHFQARQALDEEETQSQAQRLRSAEIGLIVCQDYDLYQKWLLQWGLRENELAQMRLKAVEARAKDLREVIETHEIRY